MRNPTGVGTALLLRLRHLLRDSRSRPADVLVLSLLLELSRFLHELPGAVFQGLGPFLFLAEFLTLGQFALCHKQAWHIGGLLAIRIMATSRRSRFVLCDGGGNNVGGGWV